MAIQDLFRHFRTKRSIGIDISKDTISVVQIRHGNGGLFLERAHVQQISNGLLTDEDSAARLQGAVKAIMTQEGFDVHAPAVVAMFPGKVFFHNFKAGLSDDANIQQTLKFELEDDFPIPFDDAIVEICNERELQEHDREFLVAAVSRSELDSLVKALSNAGVERSTVTAEVCGLHKLVCLSRELSGEGPSVIVHVDGSRTILAVSERNRLACVRYLGHVNPEATGNSKSAMTACVIAREIELTLRAVFGSRSLVLSKILVSGNGESVGELCTELQKQTHCEITVLDPFAGIKRPIKQDVDNQVTIALGLAMIGADKNHKEPDFGATDTLQVNRTVRTKRNAIVFGLLLLATGALLIGNIFRQLYVLEDERQRIKQQIRQVFAQTIPAEEKIVNEFAQMTEHLEGLKAEYKTLATALDNRASPLRMLQAISEKIIPGQSIAVSDISMAAESIRLSGTADSFESMDNLMTTLRDVPEFATVELKNMDGGSSMGRVQFSLLITVKTG